jgi:hypothetical protein
MQKERKSRDYILQIYTTSGQVSKWSTEYLNEANKGNEKKEKNAICEDRRIIGIIGDFGFKTEFGGALCFTMAPEDPLPKVSGHLSTGILSVDDSIPVDILLLASKKHRARMKLLRKPTESIVIIKTTNVPEPLDLRWSRCRPNRVSSKLGRDTNGLPRDTVTSDKAGGFLCWGPERGMKSINRIDVVTRGGKKSRNLCLRG